MLLSGPFPPDIRVEKEANALGAAGHDLTLICRGRDDPTREIVEGIDVRRIPEESLFAGPRGVLDGLRYVLEYENPAWKRALEGVVAERPVDAIHVHDLPLVKTGLAVGTREGISVVADLHENYPEAVREWQRTWDLREPRALVKRTFLSPCRLKRLERRCVRRVDRVLTVCEEARAHYLRECGADPRAVTVVSNTVDLDAFDPDTLDPKSLTHEPELGFDPTDAFVVSYVGSFGSHRGLETLVEASAAATKTTPNLRLVLVGSGSTNYTAGLKARARQRLGERVTFTGWVPFECVPAYMAASGVCVVLHAKTRHTRTTIPHKLFQAMAMARPLVVTDVAPLRRIVERTGCGIVVPAGDDEAMADALGSLAADPDRRRELGANGRTAVERQYNWSRDAARLTRLYRGLDSASKESVSTGRGDPPAGSSPP